MQEVVGPDVFNPLNWQMIAGPQPSHNPRMAVKDVL
jgi:hypothetical protein